MVKISVMMQKEPIALRKPLNQFDRSRLKSFRRPTFPSDTKLDFEAIGTKDALCEQYISVDPELGTDPVELFVTYYSDPKDKVPHTPEVCYRQVDTSVESMTSITIDTPGLAPKHPAIDVRRLVLSQQGSKAVILYLFYTNGRTYYDREQVRWSIHLPGERHVYFSKIEVVTRLPVDSEINTAVARCSRILREALPILVADHYPEDAQLK